MTLHLLFLISVLLPQTSTPQQVADATPQQVAEALGEVHGYHAHVHSAEKPGYSGTAILSLEAPAQVDFGFGIAEHDQEGRVITATFGDCIVVNGYVPNSGAGMKRLAYRKTWDALLRAHLIRLAKRKKPVLFAGDLNVAHRPIDLAKPGPNYNRTSGYTQTEIDGFGALLESGFVDAFRYLHPETVKYSWWSPRFAARSRNIGWRIDYVLVSKGFEKRVKAAFILNEVMGSDHCPVGIEW